MYLNTTNLESSLKVDNRKDILLLFLYSPGKTNNINEPISGRTRLVKSLFLFKEEAIKHFKSNIEIDKNSFYNFFAWNFGPFSTEIYDDLNFFILNGFIKHNPIESDDMQEASAEMENWMEISGLTLEENDYSDYTDEEFKLTEKGVEFTAPMYNILTENQKQYLKQFKNKMITTPLIAINRYVYNNYPDFTVKSKIIDKVLRS